eukprot:m.129464 g.129464  ORF g.129464 m.129464 type:complete len:291 (+) comp16761_c1_seq6:1016-1888(+)
MCFPVLCLLNPPLSHEPVCLCPCVCACLSVLVFWRACLSDTVLHVCPPGYFLFIIYFAGGHLTLQPVGQSDPDSAVVELDELSPSRSMSGAGAGGAANEDDHDEENDDDEEELPSYQTLAAQLQAARRRERGWGFVRAAVWILLSSSLCAILCAIYLALPVSMIVVGARSECKPRGNIPSWLIGAGTFQLLWWLYAMSQKRGENGRRENERGSGFEFISQLFFVVWFLMGNVWVYGCDNCIDRGCDRSAYLLAFWTITGKHGGGLSLVWLLQRKSVCFFGCWRSRGKATQ